MCGYKKSSMGMKSIMVMIFIMCMLTEATLIITEDYNIVAFDYFVLALQWPNSYCATRPQNQKCVATNYRNELPQTFTVHGLWPNRNGGIDIPLEECPISKLDASSSSLGTKVFATANTIWPDIGHIQMGRVNVFKNVDFWSAQWLKHGRCSNLQQKAYFELVLEKYAEAIPIIRGEMKGKTPGITLNIGELTNALEEKFQGARPRLSCTMNTNTNPPQQLLSEIRLHVENNDQHGFINAGDTNCITSIPVYLA